MILSPLKQFISAGHNNNDPGAVSGGVKEADITKIIRDEIAKNAKPSEIILDKDSETNRQYQGRIKPGEGSVIYDIHLNAAANGKVSGVECYVNKKDFANKNSNSFLMATEICKEYSEILDIPNRGVKTESSSQHSRIGILNLGAGIAVLVEVDFISNPKSVGNILENKEILGKITAKILQNYDDKIQ